MARNTTIRSTFDAPFSKAAHSPKGATGIYDHNRTPDFDAPHDLGGGGIPLKFYDNLGGAAAIETPTPGQTGSPIVGQPARKGTSQFPYGK